jgi:hypothetical protein
MQNNTLEFMKEYDMMQSIDHEHIVRLYGVVLDNSQIMLITELAPLRHTHRVLSDLLSELFAPGSIKSRNSGSDPFPDPTFELQIQKFESRRFFLLI